ncbi:reverse transcriptase domain-containing protein [Tanacetum coccineum]
MFHIIVNHCSLSNILSHCPQWEVCDSNTGSVVATENTGSNVVGMENEDSDGDGTVNGGVGMVKSFCKELIPESLRYSTRTNNINCWKLLHASGTYNLTVAIALPFVFVQVGKFKFLADFVVVDYDVDPHVPLILGRPFLRTVYALVDVYGEELTLRVGDENLIFNVESTYPHKHGDESINQIDIIDTTCKDHFHEVLNVQKSIHPLSGSPTPSFDHVVASLSPSLTPLGDSDFLLEEIGALLSLDDSIPLEIDDRILDPEGYILLLEKLLNNDSTKDLPPKELKNDEIKMTKSSIEEPPNLELKDLPPDLEYAFLEGTSKLPVIIVKDLREEEKDQLIKFLKSHKRAIAWKISDIRGIYPNFCTHKILIEDDFKPAVRPVHVVPKKGGMTVVTNDNNELILTRLVTGWYFQIPIDPQDQEKTTFTCPYGTFAYRRMPFGLCNAPGTFQRCMVAVFHDMIKKTMEEKCHFMVKEGIVLGHKISKTGIEVDHAKVDVIAKLPPPTMVKGIRSFIVGKFTFPAEDVFVQVGRPFLRTARALVDVYKKELILRVGDEKLTFNVDNTLKYSHKHGNESINMIDIIDTTCENHLHEVLNVQKSINPLSGSPTPSDFIVASPSPSLTPLRNSDFLVEETGAFPSLDPIPPGIDHEIFDAEGDILLLKKLLNIDSTRDLPPQELNNEIFDAETSQKDGPSETERSEIYHLIREPSDTFLKGYKKIKFNPLKDIDDHVPILRVSETPLESLDPILDTFDSAFTNPLFELDSEYTLNYDNPIFDIQNKDSDASKTETITDEVQIDSLQSTAKIPPLFEALTSDMTIHDIILYRIRHGMVDSSRLSFYLGLLFTEGVSESHSLDSFELGDENVVFDPRTIAIIGRIEHYHRGDIPALDDPDLRLFLMNN